VSSGHRVLGLHYGFEDGEAFAIRSQVESLRDAIGENLLLRPKPRLMGVEDVAFAGVAELLVDRFAFDSLAVRSRALSRP
jgi:hypothetical protein